MIQQLQETLSTLQTDTSLSFPLPNTTLVDISGAARGGFTNTREQMKARLCGLQRKPRIREYAALLDWIAVGAPNRSAKDEADFLEMLGGGFGGESTSYLPNVSSVSTEEKFVIPYSINTNTRINPAGGPLLLKPLDTLMNSIVDADTLISGLEADVSLDDVELLYDALDLAVTTGCVPVVRCLLDLGASPNGRVSRLNKANSPLMVSPCLAFFVPLCFFVYSYSYVYSYNEYNDNNNNIYIHIYIYTYTYIYIYIYIINISWHAKTRFLTWFCFFVTLEHM